MNVGKSSETGERKTWRFVRWLPTWYYALKSGTGLDPASIAIRNQLRGQAGVRARSGVQACPARALRMACMGGTALSLMVIR
jgi:hypothetical protein